MKVLTERIRSIISGNPDTSMRKKNHPFDCIKSRKGIARELMISKESRKLIGLISPSLGEGMFLILVLSLESENSEEMVAFQRYEITDGRFQVAARLRVNEIKGICTFVQNDHLELSGLKIF
jgi:hypothetical protein